MTCLLVASDLSPRSHAALRRALVLARQIDAEIHLIHVVDRDLPSALLERSREDAEAELRRQLEAEPAVRAVTVFPEVRVGHPVADVLTAADQFGADVIVLGVPRPSPIKNLFTGSTADQLVRLARCPALVVREAPAGPYRKVLAAVDFSDYARRAVSFARELLPAASMRLLHVYGMSYPGLASLRLDPEDEAGNQAQLRNLLSQQERAWLDGFAGEDELVLRAGNVMKTIRQEVEREGAELLVMGTQGRLGVSRLVLGSVASDLMRQPPCDVLVVR